MPLTDGTVDIKPYGEDYVLAYNTALRSGLTFRGCPVYQGTAADFIVFVELGFTHQDATAFRAGLAHEFDAVRVEFVADPNGHIPFTSPTLNSRTDKTRR